MAKNLLQEYCQKHKLQDPVYDRHCIGGSSHKPIWKSTVLFNGKKLTGDPSGSKVAADISAAKLALECVTQIKKEKHKVSKRKCLLVDVENMPNFIDEAFAQIEGLNIYAFVGEHHCLATKSFPDGVIKILSPSTRTDGSDTCMQVYVGFLLASDAYDTYYIATRDHYGSTLVEMITSPSLPWNNKRAKVVTQIVHIIQT
jgi:hypothetical protein